jgi:hypothetical protein
MAGVHIGIAGVPWVSVTYNTVGRARRGMTREAVMAGFERFVGDAIERTGREFSVSRALGGESGGMIDQFVGNSETIQENLVEPELAEYERKTVAQFEIILDWVESDEPLSAYRDEILAAGAFTETIREDLPDDRKAEVHDHLLARHRALGEAVEPLVDSPESEFWASARAELDRERTDDLVETHFAFTGPLREHRDAFVMKKTVDLEEIASGLGSLLGGTTFDVDFTDEAMRAMRHAERDVIADAKAEVDDRFE